MKKKRKSKNIYDEAITVENIFAMWKTIKKTCNNRREVYHFSLNINSNIMTIYHVLKNKKYKPGKYRTFMIFEPKPRLVMSQSIYDKIVNHFVTNYYLIPHLENNLIDSNVATRKEKGSKYAMSLLKKYFNKLLINNTGEIYCLKMDISKYFYSIDHQTLLENLKKKILDKDVIKLIELIISETNQDYINNSIINYNNKYNSDIPLYKEHKGLSIGAMSSQFLAIYYLNDLDHYIKEKLGCKYYIRYMDDFLILDTDKEKLKQIWKSIDECLIKLKLKSNNKSNIYKCSQGFNFLGFRYKIVNRKLKIRFYKKTYYKIRKKLKYLEEKDLLKYKKVKASYNGYFQTIRKKEKGDFKMKSIEIYEAYKNKYSNTLVIIKEGIFYHAYNDDGKILWYLFRYKYTNNKSSFGNTPYDKVIDKLKELDINFVVASKEGELLIYQKDCDVYKSYLELSKKSFDKYEKEELLINKLKKVYHNNSACYEEINTFLDKFLIESGGN